MLLRVPSAYGRSMDDMDKMCDGHSWCTTKTTNIQNDFELSFHRSTCASHLQCQNDHCDYKHCNRGMRNSTEWACSTHLPFVVGDVAPARSTFKCKVCRPPHVCISLCHARILYVYSTSIEMSRVCIQGVPGSGVELVKRMQVGRGGDMENSWIMFDHVKRVRNWTTMACHVYDSQYCKVLTIACCDIQLEDGTTQTLFWDNLNVVMAENGVSKVNFKGFMADQCSS